MSFLSAAGGAGSSAASGAATSAGTGAAASGAGSSLSSMAPAMSSMGSSAPSGFSLGGSTAATTGPTVQAAQSVPQMSMMDKLSAGYKGGDALGNIGNGDYTQAIGALMRNRPQMGSNQAPDLGNMPGYTPPAPPQRRRYW